MTPTWILMPVLTGWEMTQDALSDCLAQSGPTRILVINQGAPDDLRDKLERVAEQYPSRILLWSHDPPLPSLSATWNRALDFVWEIGGTEALVVNNDVRLHRMTIEALSTVLGSTKSLFVSGVGVTPDQFDPAAPVEMDRLQAQTGGPDFSCFLISTRCHLQYRFDEQFTPAFCEDLDLHRRLMLGGQGDRIFSVNLPFLHLSSQTLKQLDPARRQAITQQIEQGARAHYQRKWGGPVNQETFFSPFDLGTEASTAGLPNPPTTPALQAYWKGKA